MLDSASENMRQLFTPGLRQQNNKEDAAVGNA
jgi:hypothetical protein